MYVFRMYFLHKCFEPPGYHLVILQDIGSSKHLYFINNDDNLSTQWHVEKNKTTHTKTVSLILSVKPK